MHKKAYHCINIGKLIMFTFLFWKISPSVYLCITKMKRLLVILSALFGLALTANLQIESKLSWRCPDMSNCVFNDIEQGELTE